MGGVKPCATSVALAKLDHTSTILTDHTFYKSAVEALQYLTWTRIDLAFDVNQVCQYMHSIRFIHLQAVKRVLRYLKGILDLGLWFTKGSQHLTTWFDADWVGCHVDRISISGYCVFLGPNLISWSAKKQSTSSKVLYRGIIQVSYQYSCKN